MQADITHIAPCASGNSATYAPYPVQNSIHHFRADIRDRCLAELAEGAGAVRSTSADYANFADFSRAHFGPTLQAVFIRPYNEKVFGITSQVAQHEKRAVVNNICYEK